MAIKRKLSEYASYGHVGCALLTKNGNIYTGICIDSNCALGNCAEYAAIVEMLKNNESEIDKIVAYSATLVRDLSYLEEIYDIKRVKPVDMFPFSKHVEVCALLELKSCQ